ncbi:MAG: ABC transporter permease [Armatimonadetes bacterium]|nr:ABC transporter permease [Armatimonadota bacterium]MBS1710800.1 ABC transporter permease [Armatimonadota bacterium]MBX3108472.1 ABC transporter permease [Fimbriimonadaceae bacterium]
MISNPLAPVVYLRRNLSKTAPLMGVIVLAVMLIAGIVSLINSIPLSIKVIYRYSRQYVAVTPRGNPWLTPLLRKVVEEQTPVPLERVATIRGTGIQVKSIVGKWPFVVLGLQSQDMDYYLGRMSGRLIQGHLPAPGEPEAVISTPLARNLGLKIGDALQKPDDTDNFSIKVVRVVGIAESENWFAFTSYEYQQANHFPDIDAFMAFAKTPQDQAKLDKWVEDQLKGQNAQVFTYDQLEKQADTMFTILYQILNVVIGTLVVVITLMMGMLVNIFLTQRIQEFGLLQALGYTKRSLLRRVLVETTIFVVGGWILGLAVAFGLLYLVKVVLMDPHSFSLNTLDLRAYAYSIPVPVAIFAVSLYTVWARFKSFDPVGVVERRLV